MRGVFGLSSCVNSVWQVWGCGTFGVNKTELGMFYDQYCSDCELTDVQYDTIHHGVEHGDNFMEVCIHLDHAIIAESTDYLCSVLLRA